MSDRIFLDTNILVYAIEVDGPNPDKSEKARNLLKGENITLSTQVLGEFYNAVTSKRRAIPLSHTEAISWIQLWKRNRIAEITVAHVDLALELRGKFQISYYDALIISAAKMSESSRLLSEDLNNNQNYDGIIASNPFIP